jgi:hypothetical protein
MIRYALVVLAGWLAFALPVQAADPKAAAKKQVLLDLSSEALIDATAARTLLSDSIPASVWKLYPPSKWGFVSQVEGGFTAERICVVTARVMLAPLTVTNGIILRPVKRATAFDAKPNASHEECKAMARSKLKEAAAGVVSSLVKS